MTIKYYWKLIKKTLAAWNDNKLSRLAAALAYYTAFALAPLLIITIAIAGFILEKNTVQDLVLNQLSHYFGTNGANQIKYMLTVSSKPTSNVLEAIIGIIILIFAAAGFFGQLQDSINTVWGVELKPGRGILGLIRDRFFSFAMVMGLAFLFLVSMLFTILIVVASSFFDRFIPGIEFVALSFNFLFSLAMVTLIFAAIFKILPDVILRWCDVWLGAFITAILFTLGKFALTAYFGHANFNYTFGEAGSLIIILVWVYYSAQILLLGAQFTKIHILEKNTRQVKAADKAIVIHLKKHGSVIS